MWSKLDQMHSATVCKYDYGWQHANILAMMDSFLF